MCVVDLPEPDGFSEAFDNVSIDHAKLKPNVAVVLGDSVAKH